MRIRTGSGISLKWRLILGMGILGVVFTVMGFPDWLALKKPAIDITELWEVNETDLKPGTHVCFDVNLVWDMIGTHIEESKTFGVTTSSRETGYYYLLPLCTDKGKDLYPEPFLMIYVTQRYAAAMDAQIDKTDEWWFSNEDYDTIPTSSLHFDGIIRKIPTDMERQIKNEILESPGDYGSIILPVMFKPIASPTSVTVMTIIGLLCCMATLAILFVMIIKKKNEPSVSAPASVLNAPQMKPPVQPVDNRGAFEQPVPTVQSPFGKTPVQPQQSAFGAAPMQPQQSAFGGAPAQGQQSAFGAAPVQPQQSAFGAAPAQSQQSSFGSTPAQGPQQSAFGAAPAQPQSSSFGSTPAQPQQSSFGSTPAQTPQSSFGSAADKPQQAMAAAGIMAAGIGAAVSSPSAPKPLQQGAASTAAQPAFGASVQPSREAQPAFGASAQPSKEAQPAPSQPEQPAQMSFGQSTPAMLPLGSSTSSQAAKPEEPKKEAAAVSMPASSLSADKPSQPEAAQSSGSEQLSQINYGQSTPAMLPLGQAPVTQAAHPARQVQSPQAQPAFAQPAPLGPSPSQPSQLGPQPSSALQSSFGSTVPSGMPQPSLAPSSQPAMSQSSSARPAQPFTPPLPSFGQSSQPGTAPQPSFGQSSQPSQTAYGAAAQPYTPPQPNYMQSSKPAEKPSSEAEEKPVIEDTTAAKRAFAGAFAAPPPGGNRS